MPQAVAALIAAPLAVAALAAPPVGAGRLGWARLRRQSRICCKTVHPLVTGSRISYKA